MKQTNVPFLYQRCLNDSTKKGDINASFFDSPGTLPAQISVIDLLV